MTTTTADQRRARAQHEYNANLRECPGHEVLATLSDKWVTLVLSALADGALRHSELRRTVAGATQKMLTQTLRKLEREGLVSRTVDSAVPPRVDYALTPLGTSLLPVQLAVKAWAETHIAEVHAARRTYDETAGASPRTDARNASPA
jgi:DNA-binding HxlR family transcriptional regulator